MRHLALLVILIKSFLLNGVRQLDSEAVTGQAPVLLEQAGGRGQDLHEQRVDVVLEVGLLPGLAFDSLLKVDDGFNQVLEIQLVNIIEALVLDLETLS